jgi:histidinol-phosphate aminotransferase
MIDINELLRANIRFLKPYSSARDEYNGEIGVFLDANENSFGSIPEGKLNRYPDPHHSLIKNKLSTIKRVNPNQIFLGNGSDEAIDLLIRAFCEPGKDSVLIMPPTYGMYKVAADINNVAVTKVPLTKDFQIDIENVLKEIDATTKIIFLCSPNNPSGNILAKMEIEKLLNNFNGIIVIDEAYEDFSQKGSWLDSLEEYNNLVVLQTFSKAWGLANIRVGMAFGNNELISVLNKIKYPYNINGVSQKIILGALENIEQKNNIVEKIISERKILRNSLMNLPTVKKVYHSDANFLLIKVTDANSIYNYLLQNEIIIRNRSKMINCDECLRITVGTKEENNRLIDILSKYGE